MRIWSLHPSYLDWMGLGAQWREALLAQKVTEGKTKGWRNHPQLDRFKYHLKPMEAVGFYLKGIHVESVKRSYKYNYSKILYPDSGVDLISLSLGQLQYERARVPGLPEKWEKSYWVKKEEV